MSTSDLFKIIPQFLQITLENLALVPLQIAILLELLKKLDTTLHNFKIQYCSSGTSGIAGMNYAHIAAIKLSQFDVNYYAENEAESLPSASNTWYDKVVNTYSADAGDYLIMGSISYMSGFTSNSVGLDFQAESTSR